MIPWPLRLPVSWVLRGNLMCANPQSNLLIPLGMLGWVYVLHYLRVPHWYFYLLSVHPKFKISKLELSNSINNSNLTYLIHEFVQKLSINVWLRIIYFPSILRDANVSFKPDKVLIKEFRLLFSPLKPVFPNISWIMYGNNSNVVENTTWFRNNIPRTTFCQNWSDFLPSKYPLDPSKLEMIRKYLMKSNSNYFEIFIIFAKGLFKYYVSRVLTCFDPTTLYVLIVSKNCHFLNPPTQSNDYIIFQWSPRRQQKFEKISQFVLMLQINFIKKGEGEIFLNILWPSYNIWTL